MAKQLPIWVAFRRFALAAGLGLLAACGGGSDDAAAPTPPATAPGTPAGLAATAGNASVALTWTASSGATSYAVKRSTTSGGPYATVGSPSSASYSDSAVTNGTAYFYVVSAANSAGESANSTQVSATPTASATLPAAPTGLAATAGNATVALSWTASSGATGYRVKRSTSSGGPYTQIASQSGTTYADSGLANGTAYFYVVSATSAAGESVNSAQASATPAGSTSIPATPTNLVATPGNATVSLSWTTSSGAAGYRIKRGTTSGGPYTLIGSPTAAAYSDATVSNGTTYYYVVASANAGGQESANSAQVTAVPAAPAAVSVTITVDPATSKPISPYIYGVNNANSTSTYPTGTGSAIPAGVTFSRFGGNRLTAYNWETSASNAGSDYFYQNDNLLGSSSVAGAATTSFIQAEQNASRATLITVPMQGLVAADVAGPVSIPPAPLDLSRFKTVVFQKGSGYSLSPSTSDANVYMDEFLWVVDQRFPGQGILGSAPTTRPTFVSLDNEPELWNHTHVEIQGLTAVTADAYIAKTISLSTALKTLFPNLVVFGPAHYGFYGVFAWNGDSSLAPTANGSNWFTDKYLAAVKTASNSFGKPLVDVYDFHWYPEATDGTGGSGTRIISLNGSTLTDAQVQAIVQSPRSLWDPTYQESSWVAGTLGGPIYMLPRLQAKIAAASPGMKIAITEYNNGGAQHIAGTIAQADNLGVFGAQGLFAANLWPLQTTQPYLLAGFRAFRNFDGANHHFGDTSLRATSSNVANVSAYVSTDTSQPGRVVIVAINRSTTTQTTQVTGVPMSGTAHLFQMTAATAGAQSTVQPVAAGTQAVTGSSMTVSLPALSVTTIDIY